MTRYRKKQLEVEAVQWTGENREEVRDFVGNGFALGFGALTARTREGEAVAGDYFVRVVGAHGHSIRKPSYFEATYEPADHPAQPVARGELDEAARAFLNLIRGEFPRPPSTEWAQAGNALDRALCRASTQPLLDPDAKDKRIAELEGEVDRLADARFTEGCEECEARREKAEADLDALKERLTSDEVREALASRRFEAGCQNPDGEPWGRARPEDIAALMGEAREDLEAIRAAAFPDTEQEK